MKYLIIILAIMGAVTLATFLVIWPDQPRMPSDAVVTINGMVLTRKDIQDYKGEDQHHGGGEEFLNEMITRQLLIAEAQRRNIDREADFRSALKTFYEHSLIKTLMERINKEIDVEVSDEEIEQYINAYGRIYTFYTADISGIVSVEAVKNEGKKHSAAFEDLSEQFRQVLAAMQPGATATTFVTSNEKIAIYLEKVEGDSEHRQDVDREHIRQQLLQAKTAKYTNDWIDKLRKQASITYHQAQE